MRTLQDFTHAIELLIGRATAQLSVEQLDAVGRLLESLGGSVRAMAGLKQTLGTGVNLADLLGGLPGGAGAAAGAPPVSGMPQPVSGASGYPSSPHAPAPAPSESSSLPQGFQPAGTLVPKYQPPPADVDCEEAHLQRNRPERIEEIRSSSVIFCDRVFYYLAQISSLANHLYEKPDPMLSAKVDECMLSIECLPGSRPTGGKFDVEDDLLVSWQQAYDQLKDLLKREVLDTDDEQQVLSKLGDRPGGAHREVDSSNDNLRPAPTPAAMRVEPVHTPVQPGQVVLQPGQATEIAVRGTPRTVTNRGETPVTLGPADKNGDWALPAGVDLEPATQS